MVKKILTAVIMVWCIMFSCLLTVEAKEQSIVTLGQDLTDVQKDMMLKYFGTNDKESQVLIITNADEYQYLEGIATKSQIGTHAYSCCYIEPTDSGGIVVETYNINWVTSDMIKNALVTSGITNCKVVAAAPMEVSGTGSLTGVFKAYSQLGGKNKLDSEKMKAASEELIITGELAEEVGNEEASDMVETLKEIVIHVKEKGNEVDIASLVDNYILDKGLNINEEHREKIMNFLIKISDLDYDIDQIEKAYGELKADYETVKKYATDIKEGVEKTKSFIDKTVDWLIDRYNDFKNWWDSFSEKHQSTVNSYENTWGIFHRLNEQEETEDVWEEHERFAGDDGRYPEGNEGEQQAGSETEQASGGANGIVEGASEENEVTSESEIEQSNTDSVTGGNEAEQSDKSDASNNSGASETSEASETESASSLDSITYMD